MKVIFLDIDGVLNNAKFASIWRHLYKSNGYGGFYTGSKPTKKDIKWDYYNVDSLKTLMDKTGAKIVISSTWRFTHSINEFKYIFQLYGLKPSIIDITPDHSRLGIREGVGRTRGDEVNAWLNDHDVDSYVILDDDNDFFPSQNLVLTDDDYGLSDSDMLAAVEILNK